MKRHQSGQAFTLWLKKTRAIHGLSQAEMGKRLGVGRMTLIRWESDADVVSLGEMDHAAKEFDVSLEELLGLEQRPQLGDEVRKTIREELWSAKESTLPPGRARLLRAARTIIESTLEDDQVEGYATILKGYASPLAKPVGASATREHADKARKKRS